MLHLIIRYGDNLLGEFFEKYFFKIFQNFVAHKQSVDSQFQKWLEMGTNRSQAVEKNFTEMNPFHSFFDSFGNGTKKDDEK